MENIGLYSLFCISLNIFHVLECYHAVHEHFEKDQEPVIERSEHDETSENLTSTKYIDPSRVEDSSNLQDLAVLEVELTVSEPSALTVSLHSCWPFANGDWYSFCVNHKLLVYALHLCSV